MTTKVFKLSFKTPVHLGKKVVRWEMTITSDTLFSALFIEALQLGIETDWLLNDLIISDTFPYENEIYYLPKPLIKIESKEEGNHKAFKKLKYVPVHHYNQYLNGELSAEDATDLNDIFSIGHFSLQTKVSLSAQEIDSSADSEPYSVGTFTFEPEAGLYFIAKGSEETLDQLKDIMTSLQYSGLGGKRNAGYGQFEYEIINNQQLFKLLNQNGEHSILLSTAMAKEDEIKSALKEARYILNKRSGFIQSTNYSEMLVKKVISIAFLLVQFLKISLTVTFLMLDIMVNTQSIVMRSLYGWRYKYDNKKLRSCY